LTESSEASASSIIDDIRVKPVFHPRILLALAKHFATEKFNSLFLRAISFSIRQNKFLQWRMNAKT
jgi:hypothetical protein